MRDVVAEGIDMIWPQERTKPSRLVAPSTTGPEAVIGRIRALSPKDDQRSIQAQALSTVTGLSETRWLMY